MWTLRALAAPADAPPADQPPRALLASQQPPGTIPPLDRNEPVVRRTVVEDDSARIEEVNVRGAVRSIHVTPKGPIKAEYEVLPIDASRDPSAGPSSLKGSQGQRVWRVLTF